MYRTVDAETWHDAWFATLPADAKYLFLYLLTNHRTTACGAFEVSLRTVARETGLAAGAIEDALGALAPKVVWWPDLDTVWVRRFYRRQRAASSDKFTQSARKALTVFPPCVQAAVTTEYPELGGISPPDDGAVIPTPIPYAIPTTVPIPNNDNSKQRTDSREQITSTTALIAPESAASAARGANKAFKAQPAPKPGFDFPALWAAITEQQGYPLTWAFDRETAAVRRLLKAHPSATPADLARFLAYVGTCWPFCEEPTRQPTFTEGAKHWGAWYTQGQPAAYSPPTKEHTNGRYESPAERKEREYLAAFASIAQLSDPPPDPVYTDYALPADRPGRQPYPRLVSGDGRRVG